MVLNFDKDLGGWVITKNEMLGKNFCSVCKKKLDLKRFYRCEITKKFFCEECNKNFKILFKLK